MLLSLVQVLQLVVILSIPSFRHVCWSAIMDSFVAGIEVMALV